MAQNDVNKIKDHAELFQQQEYQELFQAKKEFECGHDSEQVTEIADWTKTWEYREKNFARQALTVNPAKACQPLGAILAAVGFEGTLPFVHGSQGCVAYFRSHFTRHFKEPFSAVSSSMTEDAGDGYPIFDRHHLHRYATYGYQGTINLLNWIVNTLLDELDRNTIIPSKTDISYDLIR